MDLNILILFGILGVLVLISIILSIVILTKFKELPTIMKRIDEYDSILKLEFERNRREMSDSERASRKEHNDSLMSFQNSINEKLDSLTKNTSDSITSSLAKFIDTLSTRFDSLSKATQDGLNSQRDAVQNSLKIIQDSNEKKLEQMRLTVDEKLQSTLETRLNSSFELVSKQLEAVQTGLGEMKILLMMLEALSEH